MARDASKLTVFTGAHAVALQVYQLTADMPASETFGLRSQLRRAAISVPTNIVEGCARSSTRDYLRFLEIAAGSASELRYLLEVAKQLELLPAAQAEACRDRSDKVIRSLQKLRSSVERSLSKS